MKLIFDACSLIYLAKIDKLDILKSIPYDLCIDQEVYKECVINGKKLGYNDAYILEKFINKHFKIYETSIKNELIYFRAKGECSIFILAENGICITSDKKAYNKILKRGRNVVKLEDLLYVLYQNRIIDILQFNEILEDLLKINAISIEKYFIIKEKIKNENYIN